MLPRPSPKLVKKVKLVKIKLVPAQPADTCPASLAAAPEPAPAMPRDAPLSAARAGVAWLSSPPLPARRERRRSRRREKPRRVRGRFANGRAGAALGDERSRDQFEGGLRPALPARLSGQAARQACGGGTAARGSRRADIAGLLLALGITTGYLRGAKCTNRKRNRVPTEPRLEKFRRGAVTGYADGAASCSALGARAEAAAAARAARRAALSSRRTRVRSASAARSCAAAAAGGSTLLRGPWQHICLAAHIYFFSLYSSKYHYKIVSRHLFELVDALLKRLEVAFFALPRLLRRRAVLLPPVAAAAARASKMNSTGKFELGPINACAASSS